MICIHCREKHFSVNKVSSDYVPTLQDFKNQPFIFGSISFRIESLRQHCKQSNTQHALAVTRHLNLAKEKNNEYSEAQRIKVSMTETEKKQLRYLFFNMYAVLKNGKPFSDYELQVELDKAKGIEIGNTYLNRMSGIEIARAIDQVSLEALRKEFESARFFSIILDEATDIYRLEQLILYMRYSVNGAVSTRLIGIDNVTRPTAQLLTEKIFELLKYYLKWQPPENPIQINEETEVRDEELWLQDEEQSELPTSNKIEEQPKEPFNEIALGHETDFDVLDEHTDVRDSVDEVDFVLRQDQQQPLSDLNKLPLLVGVTTDGASVLTGSKTGVQKRLKDLCNAHMIGTHCMSHRLQLAIKNGADPILQELSLFCEQLYVFHKTSNVISQVYRNTANVLGIGKFILNKIILINKIKNKFLIYIFFMNFK